MSYVDQEILAPIRARLLQNKVSRAHWGALNQDFDCLPGEVFFGNLSSAEFAALPLRGKRKGGPAYTTRVFSEPAPKAKDMSQVFSRTYDDLYNDKDSCGVFVHTYELEMLGIEY